MVICFWMRLGDSLDHFIHFVFLILNCRYSFFWIFILFMLMLSCTFIKDFSPCMDLTTHSQVFCSNVWFQLQILLPFWSTHVPFWLSFRTTPSALFRSPDAEIYWGLGCGWGPLIHIHAVLLPGSNRGPTMVGRCCFRIFVV